MANDTLGIDIVIVLIVIVLIGAIIALIYFATRPADQATDSPPADVSNAPITDSTKSPTVIKPVIPERTTPIPEVPKPGVDSGSTGVITVNPPTTSTTTSSTTTTTSTTPSTTTTTTPSTTTITPPSTTPSTTTTSTPPTAPVVDPNQIKNGQLVRLKDGTRSLGLKVWDTYNDTSSWMIDIQDSGTQTPWDWCTREIAPCDLWMLVKYDLATNKLITDQNVLLNNTDFVRLVHLQKSLKYGVTHFLSGSSGNVSLTTNQYCGNRVRCGVYVVQNVNISESKLLNVNKIYLHSYQDDNLDRGYMLLNRSSDEQQRPEVNRTNNPGQTAQWYIELSSQTGLDDIVNKVWSVMN